MSDNNDQKVSLFMNFGTVNDAITAEQILEKAREYGKIAKARLYVEQEEMEDAREIIAEISKLGIEPIVVILAKDVKLAIDILDDAYDESIDTIIISHNREDIIPALIYVKALKPIIIISPTPVPKSYNTITDEIIKV